MKSKCLIVWLVTACLVAPIFAAESEQPTLKAGAAAVNITPPLGEMVVGGFIPVPSYNVHDELHARFLVLDNGEARIGFVVCDNLGIPRDVFDDARKIIAQETDFPVDHLMMCATHTHSATRATSDRYRPFLVRRIADGVRRAIANLQPAKIGWGGVDEPSEVFNRRWFVSDPELRRNPFGGVDQVRMNPPRGNKVLIEPAGPIDPEISFVSVQTLDGKQIALMGNYSLHYVGGVRKGEISADYFGIFANRIGELLEVGTHWPSFVGMLTNGTSGDINNISFPTKATRRWERYEKMNQVAEVVSQRVKEAHASIEFQSWVPLGSARSELTLKMRKPDDKMRNYFSRLMKQPEDSPAYHKRDRIYAGRVDRLDKGPAETTIVLQAVRIGDLAIAAIPFEVFVEIGLEIKQKAPFKDAFTIELANGYYGYLPTPRHHDLGGYETWMGTCRVQKDASVLITRDILDLMRQLKDD